MLEPRTARTIDWYRTPISREALRALNQRSDLWACLQVVGHLGLIACTATLAWSVQDRWWLLLPALFLHGTVYVFLLNATHELSHSSVFDTRALNRFFLQLFCFLGWRNHILFWTSHAEHHKYTLHPPDDLEVVLPQRMTVGAFLRVTLFDPRILYATLRKTVVHAMGRVEGEWEQHLFPPDKAQLRRALANWARTLLVGHTLLVSLSLYYGMWLLPVLTTLGVFYGGWLRFLCNNTQHAGLQDDVPDFRLCTRTVILGPLTRFLYWHMNYHIEHHMYAAVPCYRLGRLHRLISHDLPESPRGLRAAWREILARQAESPS
jgi:fatty acid desaturase